MGQVFFSGSGSGSGSAGTSCGIPTSICKMLRYAKNGTNVTLKWQDPDNTIIDGQTLCSWDRTLIVRKAGSYPTSEIDGTVVLTNTTRNAYANTGYIDTLPDSTNDYYYRAFPVSVNGAVNYDDQNKFGNKTYEFIINPNDSNPATRVKYAGENANYTPAKMNFTTKQFDYGSWESAFFMGLFRPCMVYNDAAGDELKGTVMEYLDPNNHALTIDGDASHVADDTCNANAMVEIGQIWVKEWTDSDGKFHVKIGSEQFDGADCYTHINKDGTTYRNVIYRAMYDGCLIGGKIRSISGRYPNNNTAGNTQIANAQANGDGWNVDEYNLRRLINYLLILIGKSTDIQATFGTGRHSGGSQNSNNFVLAGTLNDKGMFYGDNTNGAVKVFFIENWWGNIWLITNGVLQSSGKLYYKMCEGTADGSTIQDYQQTSVVGYIDSGVTNAGTVTECYIKEMALVPKLGLVPKSTSGGSSSTYFADGFWSNAGVLGFARFGSCSCDGLLDGAFTLYVYDVVSYSYWNFGASLSYKKPS